MPLQPTQGNQNAKLTTEQLNAIGAAALANQPIHEYIVSKDTFTSGQTKQIKLPNIGIAAGVLLRITANWSSNDVNTLALRPYAHISGIIKEASFKLADSSTRHQGSRGGEIQDVLNRYNSNLPFNFQNYTNAGSFGTSEDDTNIIKITASSGVGVDNTATTESFFYVPLEIPANGMFEGGFNLVDMNRGNADSFIKLSIAPVSEYAGVNSADIQPYQIFDVATAIASLTLDSCEIETILLYREPTADLPILSLATQYSIDSTDVAPPKIDGTYRYEVEATGHTYLQVHQQLTDGGYLPRADVVADTPNIVDTKLTLGGNHVRYLRAYRTQRFIQAVKSPYVFINKLIHDWRDYFITARTNGGVVIETTIEASGFTAPLLRTTMERVKR